MAPTKRSKFLSKSSEASDPEKSAPRRRKPYARKACQSCRRLRIACKDVRPCPPCIKRGKQDECMEEDVRCHQAKRKRPSASSKSSSSKPAPEAAPAASHGRTTAAAQRPPVRKRPKRRPTSKIERDAAPSSSCNDNARETDSNGVDKPQEVYITRTGRRTRLLPRMDSVEESDNESAYTSEERNAEEEEEQAEHQGAEEQKEAAAVTVEEDQEEEEDYDDDDDDDYDDYDYEGEEDQEHDCKEHAKGDSCSHTRPNGGVTLNRDLRDTSGHSPQDRLSGDLLHINTSALKPHDFAQDAPFYMADELSPDALTSSMDDTAVPAPEHKQTLRLADVGLLVINGDTTLLTPKAQHQLAVQYGAEFSKRRIDLEFAPYGVLVCPLAPSPFTFPVWSNSSFSRLVGLTRSQIMLAWQDPSCGITGMGFSRSQHMQLMSALYSNCGGKNRVTLSGPHVHCSTGATSHVDMAVLIKRNSQGTPIYATVLFTTAGRGEAKNKSLADALSELQHAHGGSGRNRHRSPSDQPSPIAFGLPPNPDGLFPARADTADSPLSMSLADYSPLSFH